MNSGHDYPIKIQPFGNKAIVINWPQKISVGVNSNIKALNQIICDRFKSKIVESVCTYASITIYFNKIIEDIDS